MTFVCRDSEAAMKWVTTKPFMPFSGERIPMCLTTKASQSEGEKPTSEIFIHFAQTCKNCDYDL